MALPLWDSCCFSGLNITVSKHTPALCSVYSNEAGLPMVHASGGKTRPAPVEQGIPGDWEVIDILTFIVYHA